MNCASLLRCPAKDSVHTSHYYGCPEHPFIKKQARIVAWAEASDGAAALAARTALFEEGQRVAEARERLTVGPWRRCWARFLNDLQQIGAWLLTPHRLYSNIY